MTVLNILEEMFVTTMTYLEKGLIKARIVVAYILGVISYLIFPTELFKTSLMMVSIAAICDVATKWLVISKEKGGAIKAMASGELTSSEFWEGTKVKLVTYTTLSLLTGISYRIMKTVPNGMETISFLSSVVYLSLFLREFQSNIENLIDYGADLEWLLDLILRAIEIVEVRILRKDKDETKSKHTAYKEEVKKEAEKKRTREQEKRK